MTISTYKKSLLFRKAQGKVHHDNYKNKINYFLGEYIDDNYFLGLEETDKIIDHLRALDQGEKKIIVIDTISELVDILKEKTGNLPFYLLIDEEWKFCGAYKVISNVKYNYSFDFDKYASDEIRIISLDFTFQIKIDYDSADINFIYIEYEFK